MILAATIQTHYFRSAPDIDPCFGWRIRTRQDGNQQPMLRSGWLKQIAELGYITGPVSGSTPVVDHPRWPVLDTRGASFQGQITGWERSFSYSKGAQLAMINGNDLALTGFNSDPTGKPTREMKCPLEKEAPSLHCTDPAHQAICTSCHPQRDEENPALRGPLQVQVFSFPRSEKQYLQRACRREWQNEGCN